jgi:hypothetical protein
VFTFIQKK